jgi:hypothetical protein
MLWMMTLALASPQACTEVKRECRACTTAAGKKRCSNIGIASQPSIRICRPKGEARPTKRPPKAAGTLTPHLQTFKLARRLPESGRGDACFAARLRAAWRPGN